MKIIKTTVLAAALCLALLPASAMAAGAPEGTPTATDNPGSSHVPTRAEARALGRKECQEFKANFADNRNQFGKCVSAAARVVRTRVTPRQACGQAGLSRKPQGDERRSDFNACVIAAARAQREANEGEDSA
jgi:hypothetical protein